MSLASHLPSRSVLLGLCLLIAAGLAGIGMSALPVLQFGGTYADWPLSSVVNPQQLLTLAGLGLLIGQMGMTADGQVPALRRASVSAPRLRWIGCAVLLVGLGLGLAWREPILRLLAPIPGAEVTGFLTGPIAGLLTGLALVLPAGWRARLSLTLILPAAALLALATALSDPTLHAANYMRWALATELWIIAVFALVATLVRHRAAITGGRILASWMIAISLLYGGVEVAVRKTAIAVPYPPVSDSGAYPGFDSLLRRLDGEGN
ncbi:hypothetical protein [Rhizobium halophytocola]|uniref:DUF998 domain-containing protein n=1 Tax=Rhizobium halophytocola TaxID=735519 RepID=A0ABS4E6I2_9HYPH|nr:hypothetical protein [Rhizobium halophytocola]MBP1853557.1 hypothetical protein [Rhizobium halophytocola]